MIHQKIARVKLPKILISISATIISAFSLKSLPASALSIGVSPPRFELKLDEKKPTTQVFKVVNIGSKPSTFRLYIQNWTLNEKNEIQPLTSTEQSLEKWIVVNPSRFTIPPGKSQTIRFSIRPRVKPQAGEHRALIYVEEVPSQDDLKKPGTVGVKVVGRFGVAVYGYVGDVKKTGVLNSIAVDTKSESLQAAFDISSQGTAYVRMQGQYAIWQQSKYPGANATKAITEVETKKVKLPEGILDAGSLPSTPVLPETRRQLILRISKQLPPGKYVLDINGDLSGTPIDKGIPFTVSPKPSTPTSPGNKPVDSSPVITIPVRKK